MQKEEERRDRKSCIKRSTKLPMSCTAVLLIAIAMAVTSLAVVPGIASVAVAQEVELKVTLESGYAEEGGTFFATIDVDSITDLNTAKFDLSFDKSVIEVRDVKEGEINREKMPIMWNVNPDKNTVRGIINMPVKESVSGTGYLAKIEFKVKGKEGEKSVLNISNGKLGKYIKGDTWTPEEIPANWIDAEIIIGVEEEDEEEDEEEVGEEVIPGSPNITVWEPAEAVVSNAVGEPRTFNVTVNQIADISWQINGTEVQTNESVIEAIFTKSAVIGTRNVSAIATNTTTGLSDMHAWIWNVTLTPTATVTPTPTLAPGETPTPEAEIEVTPTPKPTATPTTKRKPTPTPKPTPKPAVPGFEAIFAIVGMVAIAYLLLRRR